MPASATLAAPATTASDAYKRFDGSSDAANLIPAGTAVGTSSCRNRPSRGSPSYIEPANSDRLNSVAVIVSMSTLITGPPPWATIVLLTGVCCLSLSSVGVVCNAAGGRAGRTDAGRVS